MFPDWVQPFVRVQPMSPPVEAMRSLALGGPLLWPLTMTLVWAIVLFAVFAPMPYEAISEQPRPAADAVRYLRRGRPHNVTGKRPRRPAGSLGSPGSRCPRDRR